ncbi:copper chaperone PCu(A)C [Allosphingosinicella indica]|uniref:Copper chaperone PCu(A)C n=1 Tax=Allosphingosinicella indica TaxID=941907 RepID=A0A1X7GZY7_9SPHN|nr:copper chaperone PCu(A)C [Allosphingosinicella indica]SMF77062.1 hypothetical protein SAMN06295910_2532 [Allosphingosinicella indica]
MRIASSLALAAALSALAGCGPSEPASPIAIENAEVRLPAVSGRPGAGYFAITARGAKDTLTGVTAQGAERVELHESMNEGGVMRMEAIAEVPLTPGVRVAFEPGGKHLMLFGVDPALKAGGTIPLTFSFAGAQPVTVQAKLVAPGGGGHSGH